MVFADGLLGLVLLAVWIFCIIDAITTPPEQVRNLPKALWVVIVIVLVDVGSILWLAAGRNWSRTPGLPAASNRRSAGTTRVPNPDDDEEFQRQLRARAEEQRRRAREANRDDEPPAG